MNCVSPFVLSIRYTKVSITHSTMNLLAATLFNLSIIVDYQHQEELLINRLNDYYNFDHNILLLEPTTDINRFIGMDQKMTSATPRTLHTMKSTDDNTETLKRIGKIESKNTFLVVAIETENFQENLKLLEQVKELHRLQIYMKIGLLFTQAISTSNLQRLFQQYLEYEIIHIFAAFSSEAVRQQGDHNHLLHVFAMNPFGSNNVMNLTDSGTYREYFVSEKINFQQHPIRLSSCLPFPADDRNLWLTVFQVLNASFTEEQCIDGSRSHSENASWDVVATSHLLYFGTVTTIYPKFSETVIFAVPEAAPYPGFAAYLLTITSDRFFVYALMTVACVVVILCFSRYIEEKKFSLFRSVADVASLLMNDNGFVKYNKLTWAENFIVVPVTFVGLVVVNGILSTLQSYLTRPILQPQTETMADIYKSPFAIFAPNAYHAIIANEVMQTHLKYDNWTNRVKSMDYYIYPQLYGSCYDRVGLVLPVLDAKRLLRIERKMNFRQHYIPQIQIYSTFMSYATTPYYPFMNRFNDIIHSARSAGLTEKWYADYDSYAENEQLQYYKQRKKLGLLSNQKLDEIEGFTVPVLILYGWGASTGVLFIEIMWKTHELAVITVVRKLFGVIKFGTMKT